MFTLIQNLKFILSKKDFNTLLYMSAVLTIVAFIEVGGLAVIAFLILNLENLSSILNETFIVNYSLTFLGLPETDVLYLFCGFIVLYSLFTILVSTISIRKISIFSELMGAKIKTSLLQHFLSLDWIDFVKTQSSKKMSRVINDGDVVADMINFLMNLFNKIILTVIISCVLFVFNASLTFWLAISLALIYLVIFFSFKSKVEKNSLKITEYMDATLSIVTNMFGSFKEIIFYNNHQKVLSNFESVDSSLANLKGINMSLSYIPRFLIDSALLLMLAGTSIFISLKGSSTSLFFSTLSVYGIAALKLLPAFQNIFYFSYEIYARLPHLYNVSELLKTEVNNSYLVSSKDPYIFNADISFKNVSFAYEKSKKRSVTNLNLKIQKNQKIAIIGPTGSGKSTFIDLLLGILEPNSGEIVMNGQTLSKNNLLSYRENFSYVPQKIFFLEDTLKKNITFGSNEIVDEIKLEKVIAESCLTNLIKELPNGLETAISDSNQMVSGGQKQAIGIARALYRGGDILVLDEATSGMDPELEKQIYETIFGSEFHSIICVTHKPSLLDKFDKIYIFKDGQVETEGSFDRLKENNDFFNLMLQSKYENSGS